MTDKPVTEMRTLCDYCLEQNREVCATHKCLCCGKDLCLEHVLNLEMHIKHQRPGFSCYLCPYCAAIFEPVLMSLVLVRGSWAQIGYNPEYNEARLREILAFIIKPAPEPPKPEFEAQK